MNRHIKRLGPIFLAALALTAVTASVAQAQFTSNKEHTILSGTQKEGTNHVFSTGSGFGAIACVTVTFSGTAANKSETAQTLTPIYVTCTDSLGRVVDIDNKGIHYTFTANTNAGGTSDVHVSSGELVLTTTNNSNHSSPGTVACTTTITVPQTDNGITYKNLGGTTGVEVTTKTTNVKSTVEGGFFNCGTSTTNATAGTYTGTTSLVGKDTSGAAAEISVDVP